MNEGRISPQGLGASKSQEKNFLESSKARPFWLEGEFYKPLILECVLLACAYWAGWQYRAMREGSGSLELTLISFGVLASISTLHVLLTRQFTRSLVVTLLETVAFLAPFYRETNSLLAAAGAAYAGFALLGRVAARGELQNSIEVRFFRTSRLAITKYATGLIIAVLLLQIPVWRNEHVFISKPLFRSLYAWTSVFSKTLYPTVDIGSTFIALTRGLARLELQHNPDFQLLLAPEEREGAISRVSEEIEKDIEERLGITIEPDELTSDVAYGAIVASLLRLKDVAGDSFVLLWEIAAFFMLRTAAIAFYWIALVVSFIVYELLMASGFVHIVGVEKTQELHEF